MVFVVKVLMNSRNVVGKISNILKKLGPGLLFAGAAIGVSHLVLSTQSGAQFGLGLVWALIIANFFKYPFFQYGPRYALATGENMLVGYNRLSKSILLIYFIISLGTIFSIQTAVTIVTAGIANTITGNIISVKIWTVIITLFCAFLLLFGKYKVLDKIIKYLMIILALSTLFATIMAAERFEQGLNIIQIFPPEVPVLFLIMFMGWMPAPLDVSVWQSIWSVEKKKTLKDYSLKNSIFDFNVGYIGTALLGICFIAIGYFVVYETEMLNTFLLDQGVESITSKDVKAGAFSDLLIKSYTSVLGSWAYYLIGIAALSTMFSTTITTLDASPRAMSETTRLLFKNNKKFDYKIWLALLSFGTIIIFFNFSDKMNLLIEIATILSFVTAPFYAIINYLLISSKHTPKESRPSLKMHILSVIGIIYLIGFSIFFLIKVI